MSAPTWQTENLSSNRSSALAADTLQLVLFYDGNNTCSFSFEYKESNGTVGRVSVEGILPFGTKIVTAEYKLNGCTLTGNFSVKGVQANGVVDGLAFGMFWRDAARNYHMLRSNSADAAAVSNFVGLWPLGGLSDATVAQRAAQVTDGFAREAVQSIIKGAKLLRDGNYSLPIL